jgi:hypothetical protein
MKTRKLEGLLMNVDRNSVLIERYDPVAFLTVGKPMKGVQEFSEQVKGMHILQSGCYK